MTLRVAEEQLLSQQHGSVRLFKLSKAFKDTLAVREVTLTMAKNEVFCLLGHNGAGIKTACATG